MHRLAAECGRLCWPGFVPRCRRALPRSDGAFLPSYPIPCFKHFWHRFFGCLSLLCGASHAHLPHSLSSSLARATLNLTTALLSARSRHHCTWRLRCCLLQIGHQKSGPHCESSSGSSVLLMARGSRVEEFPGCPHFIWDIFSCRTRGSNFGLFSH